MKRQEWKEKAAEMSGVPKDVAMGLPILTITGTNDLCVENYRGMTEYTDQIIRLQSKSGQIKITGKKLEVVGESLGGSRINIAQIDGITTNFSGDYPTLVVHNMDQPGHVAEVTSMLAHKSVNIATMQLYRANRGGNSVMVLECDQEVPEDGINWLRHAEGVVKVTYLGME